MTETGTTSMPGNVVGIYTGQSPVEALQYLLQMAREPAIGLTARPRFSQTAELSVASWWSCSGPALA